MSAIDHPQAILPAGVPYAGPLGPAQPGAWGGAAESAGGGITARDVWRIIKQRKILIVAVFVILYLLIGAATFLIWRLAPAYYNEAFLILIPPMESWRSFREEYLPKEYVTQRMATEAGAIRDPALLMKVLERPEIKETDFYRWYGGNFDKALNGFQKALDVSPIRETFAIKVSISVKNQKEARLIVNTVVDEYLTLSRSRSTDVDQQRLDTLKNTLAKANEDLRAIRAQTRALRETRDMPAIEGERDVLVEGISVLNNTIAELKTREADVQAQLSTIRGVDPRNLPISAEMRVIIEADPVLRYYRQQVELLDIQMESLRKSLAGENHRQMQILIAQRQGYFEKESARREELVDDLRGRQVEGLQQELARIRNMMGKVTDQLMERQAQQRDLDDAIQKYLDLKEDEERLNGEIEEVGKAYREAENAFQIQKREGRLERRLATRDPLWPSRPNPVVYLGGGFLVALLAAVGLAFLREMTDQALRTPIDVARFGRLSVLGSVPLLDEEEAELDSIEQATRRAPQSLVAEAFRQIRAHLTFSGPLESQKVLLITSPGPEDGKTAAAINLAVTLAQVNQRVLLIDCNFRRPAIRNAFQNTRAEGLSNVLIGQQRPEQVITRSEVSNVDVLSSGPMPPNPAELLGSPQMRTLLDAARAKYDRVLLDGPPCLLISDALVVSTLVDAVVLVARADSGTKGGLRRAREQFQRINVRVVGAIFNGVRSRPGGYFRQQYRDFYDYSAQEVIPAELAGGPPPELPGEKSEDNKS
jgi:capsular exopolysaccharide synthesis family protein